MKLLKKLSWELKTGILLVIISAVLYTTVYIIFHEAKTVLFYIGVDMAFIPMEILIVVLVIERAISNKEKALMMEKLNMVIGAFFSEVGTALIREISNFDPNVESISKTLKFSSNWEEKNFADSVKIIKNYSYSLPITEDNNDSIKLLRNLKSLLVDKRNFMLRLLENPILLEHDSFTNMLWATFHLTEELENRESMSSLSASDYEHLSLDIERVYSNLIYEWLQYMEHMMNNYPYLFSLAMRTNPFDPKAQVEIKN